MIEFLQVISAVDKNEISQVVTEDSNSWRVNTLKGRTKIGARFLNLSQCSNDFTSEVFWITYRRPQSPREEVFG